MAAELNPNDSGGWLQWITDFDNTYRQFQDNWNVLNSTDMASYIADFHPELQSQYDDLVSRGQGHARTLDELKATRDYVAAWLQWLNNGVQAGIDFVASSAQSAYDAAKSYFGLSGVPRAVLKRNVLNGLGIAPLVVIGLAAAAAALVVIGYWIKDAYMFAQRVNALKSQEQFILQNTPGISATEAAQRAAGIVNNALGPPGASGGLFSESGVLGIPWTLIASAAVAIFVGPSLVEALSSRRSRHA